MNPPTAEPSTEIFLGIAYLASALRKAEHEVKVIDATAPFNPMNADDVNRSIMDFKPDFIGVTLIFRHITKTYNYLDELAKLGIPIVAGGPHVNPLPQEVLAHSVDIVVLGEGEQTIVELAEYFAGNIRCLDDIRGLVIKNEDGSIHSTLARQQIKNLDELPFPDFSDFPIRNYTGSDDVNSNPIFWSIFSSRGCPFNCTFCYSHNLFGRTYRLRSAQNIFDEISNLISKFKVEKIAFQDDEILVSRDRMMRFCDLVGKSNINVKMSLRTRINSIDAGLLQKMSEVGFSRISFGIESWNNETLHKINKKYNVEAIKSGLDILVKSNFNFTYFNTLIGFPWETKKHFQDNLETIGQIPKGLRYINSVVTPIPYPSTELYNEYHVEYGFTDWWLKSDMFPKGLPSGKYKPLYYHFANQLIPLHSPDQFWKFSSKQQQDIEWFCWQVFRLTLQRHLNFVEGSLVYFLSLASHKIWKSSPLLEHAIFRFVPQKFIDGVTKKMSYTEK